MRSIYDERRRYLVPALRDLGLEIATEPTGAFYVFADARGWGADSLALAERILDEAHVSVAPGIDFGPGGEGFLRFSYATSLERLREGVARLDAWSAAQELDGSSLLTRQSWMVSSTVGLWAPLVTCATCTRARCRLDIVRARRSVTSRSGARIASEWPCRRQGGTVFAPSSATTRAFRAL